ncbi:MAG: caspase family protein [Pseudomonadota bacterium]
MAYRVELPAVDSDTPPPSVEFTAVPSQTDQPGVEVCFHAQSTGGGIGEVRLFHNGKLIASDGYYKEMAKTSEKMQLADEAATKTNILMKIAEISRKIKPSDSFIFFVAGHGVLLQNQYYMLTHDFSGAADERSMISSNEIVEMSKDIKSLSQLFIFDTCHAGGVDFIVSGLYDARMSVLAKKMGLHIYASANDKQAALDGYQGNGLFTHALLDGLNNNKGADKNKDGKVSIVGLGDYSQKTTTTLSRALGHAQTPLIINFGKDSPIYQLR